MPFISSHKGKTPCASIYNVLHFNILITDVVSEVEIIDYIIKTKLNK